MTDQVPTFRRRLTHVILRILVLCGWQRRYKADLRLSAITMSRSNAKGFFSKAEAALALIEQIDPLRFRRVYRELDIIAMFDLGGVRVPVHDNHVSAEDGPAALYVEELRTCLLNSRYILDARTEPIHVSVSIIHEATHAHLARKGYGWRAKEFSNRLEARCMSEEISFLLRAGGYSELISGLVQERAQHLASTVPRVECE